MAFPLRRPILIGGLTLSFGAWLVDIFYPILPDFDATPVWGAIALGTGVWWWRRSRQNSLEETPLVTLTSRSQVEQALAKADTQIHQLAQEIETTEAVPNLEPVARLRQRFLQLHGELDRSLLCLAVVGGQASGKTTLVNQLKEKLPVSVVMTESEAQADLEAMDLLLFLTTGDLTDSDFQQLQDWVQQNHRVLLVFNKQDQYLPDDRPLILQQLRDRVKAILLPENVVAIAAQPASFKVRQYQPDGSIQERFESPVPELGALQERVEQILAQETNSLVWTTVLRQTQDLMGCIQTELNQVRRIRALPVIEQYQWIAAAAAFANPVPTLDLVATATINTQLVMDLGAIYQQKFSLEQAKTLTMTLASQMVKLGLVELSTQAITPLLKSNLLTYVAGGMVQGLSAAYLTHLAGLSLVEYFQEHPTESIAAIGVKSDSLLQKVQAVFQANQRTAFLQGLVQQGVRRLAPELPAR
jgi:hypothetical protein